MKYLTTILAATLLLSACQQEENNNQPATEQAKPAVAQTASQVEEKQAEEGSHAGHSHDQAGAEQKGPFRKVEPKIACEQPVVMEFFAYQCPHCRDLEPAAKAWREKNAGKVKFVSVPTHLGSQEFGSLLMVHHAADALGVLESTQEALFHRIHEEKKLFGSPEEAAEFIAAQGADREQAMDMLMNQQEMQTRINRDFELLKEYKIMHVPQVMVNHQYITDVSSAGGREEVFQLVDELLEKNHNCKPKS